MQGLELIHISKRDPRGFSQRPLAGWYSTYGKPGHVFPDCLIVQSGMFSSGMIDVFAKCLFLRSFDIINPYLQLHVTNIRCVYWPYISFAFLELKKVSALFSACYAKSFQYRYFFIKENNMCLGGIFHCTSSHIQVWNHLMNIATDYFDGVWWKRVPYLISSFCMVNFTSCNPYDWLVVSQVGNKIWLNSVIYNSIRLLSFKEADMLLLKSKFTWCDLWMTNFIFHLFVLTKMTFLFDI